VSCVICGEVGNNEMTHISRHDTTGHHSYEEKSPLNQLFLTDMYLETPPFQISVLVQRTVLMRLTTVFITEWCLLGCYAVWLF
jgi:hypothetical protein